MTDIVLLDDSSADWTVRHGRSATLAVLMAQSPATVASFKEKVSRTILSHMSGDHVNIVTNGVRSAGYLILDNVANNTITPSEIITPFVRSMNHSSNDVKVMKWIQLQLFLILIMYKDLGGSNDFPARQVSVVITTHRSTEAHCSNTYQWNYGEEFHGNE